MDRSSFTTIDSIEYLWESLGLPQEALKSVTLSIDGEFFASSFKVDHLAQTCIAASALAAALHYSTYHNRPLPEISVPLEHACAEFKSERLYVLEGNPAPTEWGTIGGLHKTRDGYIRMHDSFPNHRINALKILGLEEDATRQDVAEKMVEWASEDLEAAVFQMGAVMLALRSFEEWDKLPQAKAVADFPITIRRKNVSAPHKSITRSHDQDKCLRGLRVVEMSRVIAAPVAGRVLAAHGANVIWITSPTLPDLPDLDRDLARGKRTVQLDIKKPEDKTKLIELIKDADVFIQGYRPGSLAAQGFSATDLLEINPNLIIGNLSAWGPDGPWSNKRGFDSLVQTCSGINVADAQFFGSNQPARVLPCQALDHGAGYMLTTGILTALFKQATFGGSYEIDVSLAGVMKYLRSLGRYPRDVAFTRHDLGSPEAVQEYLETRETGFGQLRAVKHSASVGGLLTGWDIMPKPLGRDEPKWLGV